MDVTYFYIDKYINKTRHVYKYVNNIKFDETLDKPELG